MSEINDYVDVNISLDDYYPTTPPFDVGAVIVDSVDVPIYDRVRVITADDIDDLTDATVVDWATAYFAQDDAPDTLVLMRQASTTLPPCFVVGDDYSTSLTAWQEVTTGALTFVDQAESPHTVTVTGLDFHGITAVDTQILTILNAALAALDTPAIVGLDDAIFAFDVMGRIVLTMPAAQDDGNPNITITGSVTPTTVAYLLGLTSATLDTTKVIPGYAIEAYVDAYNAAKILSSFAIVCIADRVTSTTAVIEDAFDLAAQCTLDKKQTTFVSTNSDEWSLVSSSDLSSLLRTAGNDLALVIFAEHTDQYYDAAGDGRFLPKDPGVAAYGGRPLNGLTKASGSVGTRYDLTSTQRANLLTKGVNFVDYVDGNLFIHKGKTATGKERRMVHTKIWLEVMIAADGFAFKMNQDSVLFDETTLAFYDATLRKYLNIIGPKTKGGRGVIDSYTIDLPELSDFTAANKAANHMPMLKAFTAIGTYEGHTFELTGSITM